MFLAMGCDEMTILTPEELQQKLKNISADMAPAIQKGMTNAAENVEARAKMNCTPGSTPYWKAPVITGTLRRSINSKVEIKGSEVIGIVGAGGEDSPVGQVEYASAVHDGTSTMAPRPFILDAIKTEEKKTIEFLSNSITEALKRHTK